MEPLGVILNRMDTQIKFNRHQDKTFNLKRINIFLGANGTGKSKTLQELKGRAHELYPKHNLIYVEGGRTIYLPDTLENNSPMGRNQTIAGLEEIRRNQKKETLASRITNGLQLLDKKGQEIKESHSDKVDEWEKKGRQGMTPIREDPPLNRLFNLFSEVFPTIELSLDSKTKKINCSKNGSAHYSFSSLSDGEKQVLSILLDIAILAEPDSLILVDEPELNLNPSLACRVWDTIENDLPQSIFIYTTHDVGFTMRSNVEKVFVLSNENENISEIENIGQINQNDLRALLGSIPAILSTNSALITEGRPDSFDSIFYRWILGTTNVEIVPMGGGSDVVAVSNRTGVWKAIAPTVKLKGIIDRDFKSEESLSNLASGSTVILEFHEAESYLCMPSIVATMSEKMGLVAKKPTIGEIETIIIKDFAANLLQIVAKRVFDRTTIKLSVSIHKNILQNITTEQELEKKIVEEAKTQTEYAQEHLGEEKIKSFFSEEIQLCRKALTTADIKGILALTPGKSLISKLVTLTGAKNVSDYARACAKHLNIEELLELKGLKQKLLTRD